MKISLLVGAVALLNSTVVWAERTDFQYYMGARISHAELDAGHQTPLGNEMLRGAVFGGELGIQAFFWEPLELRLRLEQGNMNVKNQDDEKATFYAIDALWFLNNDYNYVFAGSHYQDFENSSQPGYHLGLGARYFFSPQLALTGEVQGLLGMDQKTTDFMATLGLQYHFGAKKKAIVYGVDDQDGVANNKDTCPATPLTYSVDQNGCTLFLEQVIIRQVTISFDHDDATVPPAFYGNVASIAEFMTVHPQLNIVIEGHTSLIGTAAYNQTLSQQRAEAVRDLLVKRYHIAKQRIKPIGFGETRPVIKPEQTEEDAVQNRRIMVELSTRELHPK